MLWRALGDAIEPLWQRATALRAIDAVLARCTEVDSGARNVDHILTGTLLPAIAEHVLARMAEGQAVASIEVRTAKNGDFRYVVR